MAFAARLAWKRYVLVMRSWKMLLASSKALGSRSVGGMQGGVGGRTRRKRAWILHCSRSILRGSVEVLQFTKQATYGCRTEPGPRPSPRR
jgi:hypothetical protein